MRAQIPQCTEVVDAERTVEGNPNEDVAITKEDVLQALSKIKPKKDPELGRDPTSLGPRPDRLSAKTVF